MLFCYPKEEEMVWNNEEFLQDEGEMLDAARAEAMAMVNHQDEIRRWQQENRTTEKPRTSRNLLERYSGQIIEFKDIQFGEKIGQGGMGDVYFAKWNGSVVAVKKFRVQRVSKRLLNQFKDEINVLCSLSHPNIVKFIGACVVTPNLCILMEYMQTSLFDALHYSDEYDFTEDERLDMIKQTASGMLYLHENDIAHCDMKTPNILLDYKKDDILVSKITDFGLSMMQIETQTSTTGTGPVRNVGTPRYSAPEILRGELLDLEKFKKADMYSYSLVVYEIVYEEEPFYKLNYTQLQKQVGERGLTPEIPSEIDIVKPLKVILGKCWNRNPKERPSAYDFYSSIDELEQVYQ